MIETLAQFLQNGGRLTVLTGAGISAASGLPTYRDDEGCWQTSQPIQHADFINNLSYRQRYWARSAIGWQSFVKARPNNSHHMLARMEQSGLINGLITQNVDRLHQHAGHRQVIDLHGRIDRVKCLDCAQFEPRQSVQTRLIQQNPSLQQLSAPLAPDGDAHVKQRFISQLVTPCCCFCNGVLMPDVVFFGGNVPGSRIEQATEWLHQTEALLVVGSSLSVYSGYRFCKLARQFNKPLYIINQGKTRADHLAEAKIQQDCATALLQLYSKVA